jgi:hypothetical protein
MYVCVCCNLKTPGDEMVSKEWQGMVKDCDGQTRVGPAEARKDKKSITRSVSVWVEDRPERCDEQQAVFYIPAGNRLGGHAWTDKLNEAH